MKKLKEDFLLRIFVQVCSIVTILYVIMNISIYVINKNAGRTVTLFLAVYLLIVLFILYKRPPKFTNELVKYAANYDKIQNRLLKDLIIPYAIVDLNGLTLWANEAFLNIIGDDKCVNKSLFKYFDELNVEILPTKKLTSEEHITYNGINYRVYMNQINMDNLFGLSDKEKNIEEILDNRVVAVYLYDETEIIKCMKENNEQRMVWKSN